MAIRKVGVVGCGLMGGGIAQTETIPVRGQEESGWCPIWSPRSEYLLPHIH
jgi:hypothetical protein